MIKDRAQDVAYQYIKQNILDGRLGGGTVLVPDDIGKHLGLSRMPVRAALIQLQQEGLITFGANRRPIVTSLSARDIVELFEIRVALEGLAVERAVTNLSDDNIKQLEQTLDAMSKAAEYPKWGRLHAQFHDLIYEAAGMPRLLAEIRRIRQSIQPYLHLYRSVYQIREMPGVEHSALLDVIRNRDPLTARVALTEHIRNPASSVIYFLLSQSPENAGRQLDHLLSPRPLKTT